MPEIEITEDQYEYLEALRKDLQSDLAGRYATVRTIDAVQFLIDNHDGDLDASVDPDGPAAGAVGAGGTDSGEDDDGDASADGGPAASDGAAASDGGAAAGDSGAAADDSGGADPGGAAPGGPSSGAGPAAGGDGDDDGMLSAMMQLLDTHDGKWWEVEGDTGYEVELPDGSTESANTRDDVRALLFQHYE